MNEIKDRQNIEDYKFHHIDIAKCEQCKDFSCENVCFRGIYEVINKTKKAKCLVIQDREDRCVKCHLCTTACKLEAIAID